MVDGPIEHRAWAREKPQPLGPRESVLVRWLGLVVSRRKGNCSSGKHIGHHRQGTATTPFGKLENSEPKTKNRRKANKKAIAIALGQSACAGKSCFCFSFFLTACETADNDNNERIMGTLPGSPSCRRLFLNVY